MREKPGEKEKGPGLAQFVRGLYFELQTIEGVRPLEIWSGFRELQDSYEKAGLVKNLYKVIVPLANERCYGRPFAEHSRLAYETVGAILKSFAEDPDAALFERFPWPPTGDADQKELYRIVKARAAHLLAEIDPAPDPGATAAAARSGGGPGPVPDALFDFREMRLVDNELPYIIFTDKEFRVIHGLAIVYLWLIDLDGIVLRTLKDNDTDEALLDEYRAFSRKVRKENPLTIHGKRTDPGEVVAHLPESLGHGDYLDLFESVYSWFEQTREKLS
jgi:hypothetical protein